MIEEVEKARAFNTAAGRHNGVVIRQDGLITVADDGAMTDYINRLTGGGGGGAALLLDGSNSPMTGDVDWGNFNINNIAVITNGASSITLDASQINVDTEKINITTGSGDIALQSVRQIILQGGQTIKRTEVSDSNYTVLATDYYICVTPITATRTITLPDISLGGGISDGTVFIIKALSTATLSTYLNIVTVGGNTIDGAASLALNGATDSVTLIVNGTFGSLNYEIN